MNIVRLQGRMCNNMFQYALYLSLNKAGKKTVIDDASYWEDEKIRGYLGPFHLNYRQLPDWMSEQLKKTYNEKAAFPRRMIRTIFRSLVYQEKNIDYCADVLQLRNRHIMGFWQSEKYFSDPQVQRKLREDFSCPEEVRSSPAFARWYDRVTDGTSVSVHLRREDYLVGNHKGTYHVCTPEYYRHAIERIRQDHPDAVFYFFSDDKKYIRQNYQGDSFVVVDDPELTDLEEFFLMRYCCHHILANSTFSWWAAWLDDREDALVLAPDHWLNGRKYEDIYTDRMIRIPTE